MLYRGNIYIVDFPENEGQLHVQFGRRPAIVISNNSHNAHSSTVNVIPLTSQMKRLDLPGHIAVQWNAHVDVALCENVTTVSVEVVQEQVCGEVHSLDMRKIDLALIKQLGIVEGVKEYPDP